MRSVCRQKVTALFAMTDIKYHYCYYKKCSISNTAVSCQFWSNEYPAGGMWRSTTTTNASVDTPRYPNHNFLTSRRVRHGVSHYFLTSRRVRHWVSHNIAILWRHKRLWQVFFLSQWVLSIPEMSHAERLRKGLLRHCSAVNGGGSGHARFTCTTRSHPHMHGTVI